MTKRRSRALRIGAVALAFLAAVVQPASAANKEHQQLAADIRMLQEQAQQLQNMVATLNEAIKATNARIDEQTNAMRKAFADQKLLIDTLTSDLRVVREKVDDNNVRISALTQQLDQLRQMLQQMATRPAPTGPDATAPPSGGGPAPSSAGGAAGAPTTGTQPPTVPPPTTAVNVGASPQQLYDAAWSDYASGQWDLAVQGFQAFIMSFPTSDKAADAQVKICASYLMAGDNQKAADACDVAIRTYPNSNALPEAYYRKGLALQNLKQADAARQAFQQVVTKYPDNPAAILAKQALQRLDEMKK